MFRKNKKENKTKLEHKLYLARESPEPIFDLSECGLQSVPAGIFSLCRVFLKERLQLEDNSLSSLSGGGNLKDLCLLKVLNIHSNAFTSLPHDIDSLTNLTELYVNNNQLKKLPPSLCNLQKLQILDVSNNKLLALPVEIGNLISLRRLNLTGNKHLKSLPQSICKAQRLSTLQLDPTNFLYPPRNIIEGGTESIIKFICDDTGYTYDQQSDLLKEETSVFDEWDDSSFQAKIWTLEKIKEQKTQEFLAVERNKELLQRQELELAHALKADKKKLLEHIAQQQNRFDLELAKIHQEKELDRFRLVEQLHNAEETADVAINKLLMLTREPLAQLLEQETLEEERLLAAACKYNEELRTNDVLKAMQDLLEQETSRCKQIDDDRAEAARSILEQEMESNAHLSDILQAHSLRTSELVASLQEDINLQKAAVGALLERGDARTWGLLQQVRLVESQLAALTTIEMDRRKLEVGEQINDLTEKRENLSKLLMDLLGQQSRRRDQLLSTIKNLEENSDTSDDFWLRQYQQLLDRMPTGLSEVQKNMNPLLAETLLMAGVIHCVPFLAKWSHNEHELLNVTEEDLQNVGLNNENDSRSIIEAFHIYRKQRHGDKEADISPVTPTAPFEERNEASAPPEVTTIHNECVICMDLACQIIFVPCGHFCCCGNCSHPTVNCPLCRATIERKIRVIST